MPKFNEIVKKMEAENSLVQHSGVNISAYASGCVFFVNESGEEMGLAIFPTNDITKRDFYLVKNKSLEKSNAKDGLQNLLDFGVQPLEFAKAVELVNNALRPVSKEESEYEAGGGIPILNAKAKTRKLKEV